MFKIFNKFKIVYLSIKKKLPIILSKIFTRANINKILIIFIIGFISRIFISNIYNEKFFFYYFFFLSSLIIFINEFMDYFHLTLDVNNFSNSSFKYKNSKFYTMNSVGEGSSSNNNEEGSSANLNNFERPKLNRILELRSSEKEFDPSQDLAFQEKVKNFENFKKEFKEFYTTKRESIKLTTDELEKLAIKVAKKYSMSGSISDVIKILPADIQPLYNKFLRKQLLSTISSRKK